MTLRNIELKARLRDPDAARRIAQSIATASLGTQRQIDTYFPCPNGRLKLREIVGGPAQLVWYARPDQAGPKASDYLLVPVPDAEPLKGALAAALGICCVVDKRREILLVGNVRIHLDEVSGLGHFLEFEAVIGSGIDDAQGRAQVDRLIAQFGLSPQDLLEGSYGEMLGH